MLNLCTLALNEEFLKPFSSGAAKKGKTKLVQPLNQQQQQKIYWNKNPLWPLWRWWWSTSGGGKKDMRGGSLCLRLGFNNLRIWGVQRFGVLAAGELEDESWSWWSHLLSLCKQWNSWSMSRDLGMNHLGLWQRYRNLRSKSASFADKVGVGFLLYSMVDSLQSQTGKSPVTSQWFALEYPT